MEPATYSSYQVSKRHYLLHAYAAVATFLIGGLGESMRFGGSRWLLVLVGAGWTIRTLVFLVSRRPAVEITADGFSAISTRARRHEHTWADFVEASASGSDDEGFAVVRVEGGSFKLPPLLVSGDGLHLASARDVAAALTEAHRAWKQRGRG